MSIRQTFWAVFALTVIPLPLVALGAPLFLLGFTLFGTLVLLFLGALMLLSIAHGED